MKNKPKNYTQNTENFKHKTPSPSSRTSSRSSKSHFTFLEDNNRGKKAIVAVQMAVSHDENGSLFALSVGCGVSTWFSGEIRALSGLYGRFKDGLASSSKDSNCKC